MKMTKDEFLGIKGVSFIISNASLDKCKFPHGLTQRQKVATQKLILKIENEYQEKRREAILEYERKVEEGEIVDKTKEEKTLENAMGHPDNLSTQAARRMLIKRKMMSEEELSQAIIKWDNRRGGCV